ncbi:hypothetical protein ACFOOP_08090 [Marinicaulis aureus]|uniref:Restriction endonuclease type IV Mrr domain-containing protein n=1 Tax=Hyphococcus aureus TaxID=2666033 RepID=A0ABW1KUP7_9PROT
MAETRLNLEFADLVIEILRKQGLGIRTPPDTSKSRADFFVDGKGNSPFAVGEVKIYRTVIVPAAPILRAAKILDTVRAEEKAERGFLVVGNAIAEPVHERIKSEHPALLFLDIKFLNYLVQDDPELAAKLDSFVQTKSAFSEPSSQEKEIAPVEIDLKNIQGLGGLLKIPTAVLNPGVKLAQNLSEISPGKPWREFENACLEALKYIFQDDLVSWSSQNSTETGMSRFDAIARVSSRHDFWNSIVTEFGSRYIIFEFKNHADKIKQGEVYTTEKYLYRTALRSMAVIISPFGPDPNALTACRRALREHGKLIINLTVSDLKSMLTAKDNGDDQNAILVDLLDDFLMKLEA